MHLLPRGELSDAELRALEDLVGALPLDYRRFIAGTNGGRPAVGCVVAVPGLPGGGETDVSKFFGWNTTAGSSDIRWALTVYAGRIPGNSVPIASDSGGGVFCMMVKEPSPGSVVFCDMGNFAYDADGAGRDYLCARTFEQFLEAVRPAAPN